MEYNDVLTGIGQLGFPVFVAVWYMFKQSQDTKEMREALVQLKEAIILLKGD